ncbi:MAG TPA: succinyl-diaminopimelate desuccinylase [Rhizomicrobium sp.]|jgi:succinyl-diaminopimelate desuccinylase|nr:succinyl-diaminopimelate desuccinylase [Rhizomicrobium sp.]
MLDPVVLAQELIRCPSVTPADAGALGVLEAALAPHGFSCTRLRFEAPGTAPIDNLYARIGSGAPNFCFAGHTDVVPPGDAALWRSNPFAAEIRDRFLYGRGAADMKSAIAAFAAAAARHLEKPLRGSISLLITGDEEGPAVNGTAKVLEWLAAKDERIDHCIVGEPTASACAGDTIKIGRRGSMRVDIVVRGVQGHTAYPLKALNPIPVLATLVARIAREALDTGTPHFEPSTLAFTTFDVGNPAGNVSPALARASANIRFNDLHTPDDLVRGLRVLADEVTKEMGGDVEVSADAGALPFVTAPGPFTELLSNAVQSVTGRAPQLSTTGGTSDARFIRNYCPVAEIGLAGTTMHKVDECVPVMEIETLTAIYASILDSYFSDPPASAS